MRRAVREATNPGLQSRAPPTDTIAEGRGDFATMDWEPAFFQTEAARNGGVVQPFQQGLWLQLNNIAYVGGGCVPLSIQWIICQQLDFNLIANQLDPQIVGNVRRMCVEYTFNPASRAFDSNYPDAQLAPYGIQLECVISLQNSLTFITELVQNIRGMPGGYFFIGFQGYFRSQAFSGHAIAVDSHRCAFFDPNLGQATFTGNLNGMCATLRAVLETCYRVDSPTLIIRRYRRPT